jgi:acyl-CoA dehydrogenase
MRLVPPAAPESDELLDVRLHARAHLQRELQAGGFSPAVDSWLTGWDPDFSRRLGEHGLLGVTVPTAYGGQGRTHRERFVITEELLAAGAPVAAHWIADRQIAPTLLRFGSEEQKNRYLPGIAAGTTYFAIGMSEPDAGSDLASVRTRAQKVAGGWTLNGTKVWTSGAHLSEAFFVLARSSAVDPEHRHDGLSQFIVDLHSPGVSISPILWMDGGHHFNEVSLVDVFVPDEMVLGEIGNGWHQVTSELGFERSGPERFLSTLPILEGLVRSISAGDISASAPVGRALARLATLHQMSGAIAGALAEGQPAEAAAAAVKVLGTTFEGDVVEIGADYADELAPDLQAHVRRGLVMRPGFTLRGGTNEVLRSVLARELGLR